MEIVEEYDFNPHELRHAHESPFAIRAIPSFRSGISTPEAKPLAPKNLTPTRKQAMIDRVFTSWAKHPRI